MLSAAKLLSSKDCRLRNIIHHEINDLVLEILEVIKKTIGRL